MVVIEVLDFTLLTPTEVPAALKEPLDLDGIAGRVFKSGRRIGHDSAAPALNEIPHAVTLALQRPDVRGAPSLSRPLSLTCRRMGVPMQERRQKTIGVPLHLMTSANSGQQFSNHRAA